MTYVVFDADTTVKIAEVATQAAASRKINKMFASGYSGALASAPSDVFTAKIEKKVLKTNLMSGVEYFEPINTPRYMSPASEAYWSM